MIGTITIQDDATLQQMLTLLTIMPDSITIPDRVFCKVPLTDYNSKLDSDLGDGRVVMSSKYNSFYSDESTAYVLVGEDSDDYGNDASGSRNLINNPVTKEEMVAWVNKYGAESFHLDYPRVEAEDI